MLTCTRTWRSYNATVRHTSWRCFRPRGAARWRRLLCLALLSVPLCAGPVEFGRAELQSALEEAGLRDLRIETELGAEPPESFRIERGGRNTILIRGGDLRGLLYGLLEAAEQVRLTRKITPVQFRAAMPIRGVRLFVHSEAVEREHTREYWLAFIRMLARQRFNRLNLVFAHQTAFLAPPYPFWVEAPGFPGIRARNLSAEQRERNLELLRYISQTAADHGVDFTLGIWEHNVQPGMQPSVDGLTAENIGPYSYAALKAVLQACPAIRGVQMRTNSESGIPAPQQLEFYRDWVFRAIREAGRLVHLEVRGWLMQKGMLEAALQAGVPLRISSKYWAEDIGRPYPPAETWPNYSFLNFLERWPQPAAEPETRPLPMLNLFPKPARRARPYDFFWELWGLGSHRLFVWGDPVFVRRAVRTFTLSDSQGFEIDPPLAQRGFGNTEAFGIFTPAAKDRVFWTHDFERYWMFYLLWGRLSFDPETNERVWMSELRRRFGEASSEVARAYSRASQILNEIVTVHLADPNMYIWPEINPGGLIEAYKDVRPSDWAYVATVEEAVRNRVEKRASAKQTPVESAARLHAMAADVLASLGKLRQAVSGAEWLSTATDFEVLANLAIYHGRKLMAADGLVSFYQTGSDGGLYSARRQIAAALAVWKRIVELTDGVYPDAMNFGPDDRGHWKHKLPYVEHDVRLVEERVALYERFGWFDFGFDFGGPVPASRGSSYRNDPYVLANTVEPRFRAVAPETVWSDESGFGWVTAGQRTAVPLTPSSYHTVRAVRVNPPDLPSNALFGDSIRGVGPQVFRVRTGAGRFAVLLLRRDGSTLESEAAAQEGVVDVPFPESEWEFSGLILKRLDAPRQPAAETWPTAPARPAVEHAVPSAVPAGKPLSLTIRTLPGARVTGIRLYYRPLNQLEKFRTLAAPGSRASFTIPPEHLSPKWDLQYYFEILHEGNGGWFHPDPHETTPYFVLRVEGL